ncbi:hypothetical protein [Erythrobacter sp. F6033]|uniref:hypothetical protein n=1 Tax=Erythrobacter sp. F6033 TaxID=2926401 RepID=UPI001FF2146F|nr:hypothetical protein [Erythrobacter sp. F6033]MCK0128156.1 hypothetical protein [Erythrobacter sp. F6033]
MRWITALSLVGAFVAMPAHAADNVDDLLACVDTGYTADEQAVLDRYIEEYSINDTEVSQSLGMALRRRVLECTDGGDTSMNMMLSQHQFALLSQRGIQATRPDVVEVVRRIDTQLSETDNARFMALFEKMVFGDGGPGADENLNANEAAWFEETLIDEPVSATVEQSELIGGYLAARLLRAKAVEQLAGT